MTSFLGHEKQQRIFRQAFDNSTLHHAWILAGDKGLGKAGFAEQAAKFLLDDNHDPDHFSKQVDNQTSHLMAAGSHPDFRKLKRGPKGDKEEKKARDHGLDSLDEQELARNIKISQVRSLQPLLNSQPSISSYRVVVIDAIDDLERNGANALLKNLEEPPKNTVFLLVSHAPERLLPTIRSRCQVLRFDALDDKQMQQLLREQTPKLDDTEIAALVAAGEGSPGRALQFVDAGLAELDDIAKSIMHTGDRNNALKTDLARKLSLKAAMPRYQAFIQRVPNLMAQHIRTSDRSDKIGQIDCWREARDLAAMAVPKSLDSQSVVFRLSCLMGSLAQSDRRA